MKEILDLITSNEGDKFIKKKINRALQAKQITKEEENELLEKLENRVRQSEFNFDSMNKEMDFKETNPNLSEEDFLNKTKAVIVAKENYSSTKLEELILVLNIALFTGRQDKIKEFANGGSIFVKDIQKNLNSLSELDMINIKWLCENDRYLYLEIITQEEHIAYTKRLFDNIGVFSGGISENFDFAKLSLDIRQESFISKGEFKTQETIVRDFDHICNERLFGRKRVWQDKNGISGAANEPAHFKTESDFEWLREKLANDMNFYLKSLEEFEDLDSKNVLKIEETYQFYLEKTNELADRI
ncbi:hypothetical protein AB0W38_00535 [Aliarcobacter butzleri]|uniref:hypothetical protein n=1 Tax=Aliarcobacter butzleri TaxID=28197 RepID=UPI00344F1275